MIVEIETNLWEAFLKIFRRNSNIIKANEFTHYKGLGNESNKHEEGDYLVGVTEDGFKIKEQILGTYLIIGVNGNILELELLSYNTQ